MTELSLDDGDLDSLHHELVCVRMAEAMSMNSLPDPGLLRQPGQQMLHVGLFHRPALQGAEKGHLRAETEPAAALNP